jgi:hypothetical protein
MRKGTTASLTNSPSDGVSPPEFAWGKGAEFDDALPQVGLDGVWGS